MCIHNGFILDLTHSEPLVNIVVHLIKMHAMPSDRQCRTGDWSPILIFWAQCPFPACTTGAQSPVPSQSRPSAGHSVPSPASPRVTVARMGPKQPKTVNKGGKSVLKSSLRSKSASELPQCVHDWTDRGPTIVDLRGQNGSFSSESWLSAGHSVPCLGLWPGTQSPVPAQSRPTG